jgi:hypothetical protein
MSLRSGLQSFTYPIFTIVAAPTDAAIQFPIPIAKGTYLIEVFLSIVCSAVPTGVVVSLQNTNAAVPGAVPNIIVRNTATATNAAVALPSGATTTQVVSMTAVYTFPADGFCYLNVGTNGVAGVDTFTLASSTAVNTVQFVQLAP